MRDEERRLREADRESNVSRMLRAKAYHDAELKRKFAAEDAREAARKETKAAMVESHRVAGLASMLEKQRMLERIAKARGHDDLVALMSSASSLPPMAAAEPPKQGGGSSSRPGSSKAPRPPPTQRPVSARPRLENGGGAK